MYSYFFGFLMRNISVKEKWTANECIHYEVEKKKLYEEIYIIPSYFDTKIFRNDDINF